MKIYNSCAYAVVRLSKKQTSLKYSYMYLLLKEQEKSLPLMQKEAGCMPNINLPLIC